MLKTVKIDMASYKAAKALAKKRGVFLQHLLNEVIRIGLQQVESQEKAA